MSQPSQIDRAKAELVRRLLDPLGPVTGPVQTFDEILADIQERDERCEHAVALTKAGFWNLASALLAQAAARDLARKTADRPPSTPSLDIRAEQPECKSERARVVGDAEASQALRQGTVQALQHTKAQISLSGQKPTQKSAQEAVLEAVSTSSLAQPMPEPSPAPSSLGLSAPASEHVPAPPPGPKPRLRRRSPSPRKAQKKRPKLKRLKTISNDRHEAVVTAYLVAQALGFPFNVTLDFNPGIDHLDHPARLKFWAALIVNIQSYIRSRCDARGKPYSWWLSVFIGARESKPHNSSGEHLNGMIHVPDKEEFQHLLEHLKKMRRKDDRIWCHDIVAKRADDEQRIEGRKVGSRLDYVLKAAHRDTRARYPYMIYKRSGFITGERVMISKNLTDPKVVASVEKDVAMRRRLRDEKRSILIAEILRRDAPPYPWE